MGKLHICKILLSFFDGFVYYIWTVLEYDCDTLHVHYPSLLAEDSYLVVRIPSIFTAVFTAAMK